jgi:hypothetical protein
MCTKPAQKANGQFFTIIYRTTIPDYREELKKMVKNSAQGE